MFSDVAGRSGWCRTRLEGLKCMCQTYGMPQLFRTLTADEVSDTHFDQIEALLQRVTGWEDQPERPLWTVRAGPSMPTSCCGCKTGDVPAELQPDSP